MTPRPAKPPAVGWIVLGQDRKVGLRVGRADRTGTCATGSRRPIPPQAPEDAGIPRTFLHRLAARTGLASAAQTRTQTDDGTCDSLEELGGAGRQLRWLATLEPAKVMEPTEEDDADDVDHEVDESSKKTR